MNPSEIVTDIVSLWKQEEHIEDLLEFKLERNLQTFSSKE